MNSSNDTELSGDALRVQDMERVLRDVRELKKHLKSLSKNQLIEHVVNLATAQLQQIQINQTLNEQLKKAAATGEKNEEVNTGAN